jgi:serine/threonine-protein kinase
VDETTRLDPGASGAVTRPASDSGWLSSSGSIDHGRFGPGTILDSRYRILGLLGRGGMGEVYRADDLRLGQQVALKFLPVVLSTDPGRLAQFHNEVRTARQVSHPNVCRVYDIGEIEGQLFITMEYVDGEDLAALLRRIGRLPEDKGIEIARQICAGLAAAHERGVLHRDLKPANVMLDGAGRVRLMDFSLAAAGAVTDIRAGTPAYMAPEQLAGQEVTVRSDIYALGLVLYEIFTGRRAYDAKTLAELVEQHQSGTLTAPTTIVKSLDPAIEAAIVRCLDPTPSRRPPSAIAVSAALPGGDPLAAALAAGETPSPEMVAAAGGDAAALSTSAGTAWLVVAALSVIVAAIVAGRFTLLNHVPLAKPAAVLADRAEQIRTSLGYADSPRDTASGFYYDTDYFTWAQSQGRAQTWYSGLTSGRPAVVRYWHRTSPVPLVPFNWNATVSPTDPPVRIRGMTALTVDTEGRLLRFQAVPPQVETPSTGVPKPVDWKPAFAAAGLDPAAFTEVAPSLTPSTFADERRAWKGTLPGMSIPVTIEAAAYRGRPIMFDVVDPWTKASREPENTQRPPANNWIFVWLLLAGAAYSGWRNLRDGRADRRGAFRLAAFMAVVIGGLWVAGPHLADFSADQQAFFARAGIGLFVGGAMYLVYLGFEPFVRKLWPSMLVGWSRVLNGRLRDPLVGRDALIGVASGGTLAIVSFVILTVLPYRLGLAQAMPQLPQFAGLTGVGGAAAAIVGAINLAIQNSLITVFEFTLFRAVFEWLTRRRFGSSGWTIASALGLNQHRSDRLFVALAVVATTLMNLGASGIPLERYLPAISASLDTLIELVVLLRIGLFATVVMFFTSSMLDRMPMAFASSSLLASSTWATLALLLGIAVLGFRLATRPGRSRTAIG